MANKTGQTAIDPADFLAAVPDATRRADALAVAAMMTRISGEPPAMWGPSIVGFGRYHYRYDSGHEGEMCRIGFSPRAKELVLYVLHETPREAELLARLGRHHTGKSCLYLPRLDAVDAAVLETIVVESWAEMARRYPA